MSTTKSMVAYLLFIVVGFILIGTAYFYHPGVETEKLSGFHTHCLLLVLILSFTTIMVVRLLLRKDTSSGKSGNVCFLFQLVLSIYVFFVIFLPAIGVDIRQVLH